MRNKLTMRVLAVALSISISAFNSTGVKACTIDDLREYLGLARSTEDEYMDNIIAVINSYDLIETHNELVSIINSNGYNYKDSSSLDELVEEIETKEKEFQHLIKNGGDISEIKGVLNELENMKKNYEMVEESVGDVKPIKYKKNVYKEEYEHVLKLLANIDDKTYIGELGNKIQLPTSRNPELIEPFGKVKNGDEIQNRKSIRIREGINGSTAICSMPGDVESIIKKDKKYTIRIEVTPLLYLEYSGLETVTVEEGQEVMIGYPLGGVSGKKSFNFKVELDEVAINPVLLFGRTGWNMYNSWKIHNSDKVVNELLETDFWTTDFVSNYVEETDEDEDSNVIDRTDDGRKVIGKGGYSVIVDENYEVPKDKIVE